MPKFIYKAKKSPAELIEETITADNKTAAIQKVSNMGYYLISIEEYIKSREAQKTRTLFSKRVGLKDITNFTRQLSDLLESGLTIAKALDILHQQTENKALEDVILDIRDFCMDGNPFSSALERHPRVFSNLFVSMVRSGESGGALDNMLKRLADFNDSQLEIQTKVKTALAYPILMAILGVGTITVLLTFVIPKMMTMFGELGQNLPLPTLILIKISNFIKDYWWLILAAVAAAVLATARFYGTKEGRAAIDRARLKVPLLGDLAKKMEIARFGRTLSTLLNNGVPILESLGIVADTLDNAVIKEEVRNAASKVKEGSDLAGGFRDSKVMPPIVINMIAVGEEGGRVEKSLIKVAESYERETDATIKALMSLLEPVMILVLGGVVGFIVISMLLPIFEINFLAR